MKQFREYSHQTRNPSWAVSGEKLDQSVELGEPALVDAYDARFPVMEKRHQPSQELFSMLVRSVVE